MSPQQGPVPDPSWRHGQAALLPVPPRELIVGVAHDARSGAALEWAAAEAAARNVPLRIVHAFRLPTLTDAWAALSVPAQSAVALEAAQHVLHDSMCHALKVVPDLEVSTHPHNGSGIDALLTQGTTDALLVVGAGAQQTAWARLRGSTATRIAEKARTPLVAVTLAERPSPGSSQGRVVVGVSQVGSPLDALGFAFDAARRRSTGLTAVRAWSPLTPDLRRGKNAIAEREQREHLRRLLRPYEEAFPDVEVRHRVLPVGAVEALMNEAGGASLLVLGSRGHRGLLGGSSGHVRRALLSQVHTPVAIVPARRARGTRPGLVGSRNH